MHRGSASTHLRELHLGPGDQSAARGGLDASHASQQRGAHDDESLGPERPGPEALRELKRELKAEAALSERPESLLSILEKEEAALAEKADYAYSREAPGREGTADVTMVSRGSAVFAGCRCTRGPLLPTASRVLLLSLSLSLSLSHSPFSLRLGWLQAACAAERVARPSQDNYQAARPQHAPPPALACAGSCVRWRAPKMHARVRAVRAEP